MFNKKVYKEKCNLVELIGDKKKTILVRNLDIKQAMSKLTEILKKHPGKKIILEKFYVGK